MWLMLMMRGMSRGDLRASTSSPDALDINHTDRLRGRLSRERHMAANVAVIVRSAHAERTDHDGPPMAGASAAASVTMMARKATAEIERMPGRGTAVPSYARASR